jgi:hypothetical protein
VLPFLADLFDLFTNVLVTLSHLNLSDLEKPAEKLLPLIKTRCQFPDSFLGLYRAPAAAVNMVCQLVLQYPYVAAGSPAQISQARTWLAAHLFPFYLSVFSLRVPDSLLHRLLAALNSVVERFAFSGSMLYQLREFHYKFVYAFMQPAVWNAKNTLVKNVREKTRNDANLQNQRSASH